jgi:hypothetical protein
VSKERRYPLLVEFALGRLMSRPRDASVADLVSAVDCHDNVRSQYDGGAAPRREWGRERSMDAQRYHDEEYWKDFDPKKLKLISREKLEALLRAKNGPSGEPRRSGKPVTHVDPLEEAMREHPGLTREEAEEMAESFGF